jgi:hypothetical protein
MDCGMAVAAGVGRGDDRQQVADDLRHAAQLLADQLLGLDSNELQQIRVGHGLVKVRCDATLCCLKVL